MTLNKEIEKEIEKIKDILKEMPENKFQLGKIQGIRLIEDRLEKAVKELKEGLNEMSTTIWENGGDIDLVDKIFGDLK